ncbi:sulfatase family protein [Thalassotalea sp. ND16A]|uniref:sulfatase family protein n=1 Tax=Thalassotalea sp. ND16A TaxID=1535422 RepID=UPI00051D09C7|nr:sulfatase [Thalassotalea sp. ND16A]KGK00113.1 hypothetical protein ND16A_0304 [Thalassotalea sp. ND16A]
MLKLNQCKMVALALPLTILTACMSDSENKTIEQTSVKTAKPNIIFIMSDDHSERAISAYGSKIIDTPSIDRIANEGVIFNNSFVANSICGPSRAIMLTGKHSHINGFTDNSSYFDGSQATYPKYLQQAGYQTAIVGKWHLASDPEGFDYWEVLRGQGHYYSPEFITNTPSELTVKKEVIDSHTKQPKTVLENTYHGAYATRKTGDLALNFLEKRDTSKPFVMIYNHKAPHRNWMPDVDDLGLVDTSNLKVPANFYDDYTNRPAAALQELEINDMYLSYDLKLREQDYQDELPDVRNGLYAHWQRLYNRMTAEQKVKWDAYYNESNKEYQAVKGDAKALLEWKYRRYMHDYLSSIKSMDNDIGRILDYLDENGLAENTIVVYTSDQGFFIGEHGWFDKRFMYEETMRTPLVIRYPNGIKAGQAVTDLVQNIDYAPTFLDFAGIDIPADIQGVSLKDRLVGDATELERDSLYYHYYEGIEREHKVAKHQGVRTKTHKLIHFKDVGVDHYEMYDIVNDPSEMNNLYGKAQYRAIQQDLHQQLRQLRINYNVIKG